MRQHYMMMLFIALFTITSTVAQNFSLLSSTESEVRYAHDLDPFVQNFVQINGEPYQNFAKTTRIVLDIAAEPAMPYYSKAVLLPNSGAVTYEIEYDSYYDIENIAVAPSKGALKRNINPEDVPYTLGPVYHQDEFYPGELAQMSEPFILRKTRGVTIGLLPYQYNPVTKTLRVYENLRVIVTTDTSVPGQNELVANGLPASEDVLAKVYQDIFINPPVQNRTYTPVDEYGSMLIIAHDDYVSAIAPLADWKNRKGIKTVVVSTSQTGTTAVEIKDFISGYYSDNPELIHILLVGDSDKIPAYTYGFYGGEEHWSDSYYGQLAGGINDFYPEAFVGRFSGNLNNINTMVQRTLEYELNPLPGNWMTNALGLASNEGAGYGDDGESDFQHLRNIRTQLINYGYNTVYEFYQGSQGGEDAPGEPTPAMINQAVETGVSLFNYTGHGWTQGMATGNYTNASVNNLQNNGKYPFVISVACNNGTFVGATCLAEAMLNKTHNNQPAGFIAAAGSSILMSWAPPMQTQDEMANIITEMYESNRKETLGGLFYNSQISVLVNYNNNATAKEVMQTWVLFGDPSVSFRFLETENLVAEHLNVIPANATSVSISSDTENAYFAVSQDGIILGTGHIIGGVAEIEISEISGTNPIHIVGTKQNFKPYEGEVNVGTVGINDFDLSHVLIYPNPADEIVTLDWNAPFLLERFEMRDLAGRLMLSVNVEGQSAYNLNVSTIPAGIYLITLQGENGQATQKLVIK